MLQNLYGLEGALDSLSHQTLLGYQLRIAGEISRGRFQDLRSMSEVTSHQSTVDLFQPPRSDFGLRLLITPSGDPIGFQIQAWVLRINRAEDFELAECFGVLSALFPISDLLDYGRDQVAALRDPVQAFLEMRLRRVKPERLRQDRNLSVQIRFYLHVTIGLGDIRGKVLPLAFTRVELQHLK